MQIEGLTTVFASNKPYVLLSFKSMSVINSRTSLMSMFSQYNESNTMYPFDVKNFQFNTDDKMVLFAYPHKSLSYSILHKRIRHPTVHTLKQVMKHCDHTFDLEKNVHQNVAVLVSLVKATCNTFLLLKL